MPRRSTRSGGARHCSFALGCTILCATLWLLTACGSSSRAPDVDQSDSLLLGERQPTASFEFDRAALDPTSPAAAPLIFELTSATGLEGESFEIRIVARWGETADHPRELELGRVTPFPAGRLGRYTIRPPAAFRALLANPPPDLHGVIELCALPDRSLPVGLKVEISEPRVRRDAGK